VNGYVLWVADAPTPAIELRLEEPLREAGGKIEGEVGEDHGC